MFQCVVDQDSPHDLGGDTIEVLAVRPDGIAVRQPHVRLVDQCGGLQRVVSSFAVEIAIGDGPQLVVDEGEQSGQSVVLTTLTTLTTLSQVGQDLSDLILGSGLHRISHKSAAFFGGVRSGFLPGLMSEPDGPTQAFSITASLWEPPGNPDRTDRRFATTNRVSQRRKKCVISSSQFLQRYQQS